MVLALYFLLKNKTETTNQRKAFLKVGLVCAVMCPKGVGHCVLDDLSGRWEDVSRGGAPN